MVHRGDSQDISAFPHACARVYAYVCRCVGSLSLAKMAWLCLVSSWPWYVKLNHYSAVSLAFAAAYLIPSCCSFMIEMHLGFGVWKERISFVVFRKIKDEGLCSYLAKCIVMRCLAPVCHFWLPWVALAASASRRACVQVGWGSLTFLSEFMDDFLWNISKFSHPMCPGFAICNMRCRY